MTSFKFEFDSVSSQFQERDSYNGTWAIQGYTVSAPDDVYDGMSTFGFLYANPEVTWEDFPASIIGSQKWYQKEYKRLEDERERRENELDYDLSEEYYPKFEDLDMKAEEFENWIFSKNYSFEVLKINSFNYKCTYSKWDDCGDCDEYKEGVKAKFKVFGTTCFGQSFEIKAEDDDASFEPDENVIAYMCSYTETEYESKMDKAYVPSYIPFKEMVNKMRNTRNNDGILKSQLVYTVLTSQGGDEFTDEFGTMEDAVDNALSHWGYLTDSEKRKYTNERNGATFSVWSGTEEEPMWTCILDFKDVLRWEQDGNVDANVRNAMWIARMDEVQSNL